MSDGAAVRPPERGPLSGETVGAEEGEFPANPGLTGRGIACDIGTTTVVCHLVDLSTGSILDTAGEGNAQHPLWPPANSAITAALPGRRHLLGRDRPPCLPKPGGDRGVPGPPRAAAPHF